MTKKYLLGAILSILFTISSAHAGSWNGWIYQNPYPTANTLLAVKFITPQKGWIAGEKGMILYTEDGGDTWEAQESGTEQDIKSITFVNEKQGWAVGNGGTIIHTENGGKTWKPQGDANVNLRKVFFINDKEGWIVGDEGIIFHTSDSSKKWEKTDIGTNRSIASIFFLNPQTGWILAGDEVYSTKDGGKKWDKTKLDVKFPRPSTGARGGVGINISEELGDDWRQGDIYFTDEKNGWAVFGLGYILHTEDSGKTWINQRSTGDTSELRHIAFRDTQNGCAIGSNILCTEDGGKTWNEKLKFEIGDAISLKGISFTDKNTGWAVGADGTVAANGKIMKTEDGGKSWKMVSRKEEDCGGNTYFVNKKTGWLHKPPFSFDICRTDDGGYTWMKQEVGIEVVNIFFINDLIGWAVGRQTEGKDPKKPDKIFGVIRFTTDGGKNWSTQFEELMGKKRWDNGLVDAYFLNSEIGWIVAKKEGKGIILKTEDGGKHWQEFTIGKNIWYGRIWFADAEKGWFVGHWVSKENSRKGFVLSTDDGGEHWHAQHEIDDVDLDGVFFIDERTGWAIGETEYGEQVWLLDTKDAGKTWSKKMLGNISGGSPAFLDKDRGVLVSEKGFILITTDGGKTWTKKRTPLKKHPWHFSEIFEKETQGGK